VNLLVTMLIGGLWHGAGWTFVVWGALHGVFLIVNHAWRSLRQRLGLGTPYGGRVLAMLATFVAVVVGWVFFRAPDFETATGIIGGMIGHNGVVLPAQWQPAGGVLAKTFLGLGVRFGDMTYFHRVAQLNWLLVLLVFCWVAPNTQQVLAQYRPALMTPGYDEIGSGGHAAWRPDAGWMVLLAILGVAALLSIPRYSEFIYSRF
jgi:alginate O-acetyltransferase complex protein AlgI